MLSKEKLAAKEYITKEYNNLNNAPITEFTCSVSLVDNDIFHWKVLIEAPKNSPYSGGKFFLSVDFPDSYPQKRPEIRFINRIYHPNVNPTDGYLYIDILSNWEPKRSIRDVIFAIFLLLYKPNPNDYYNRGMAEEYSSNRSEFDRKAKEWTKKYAS